MPSIDIQPVQVAQNENDPPQGNSLPSPLPESAQGNTSLWNASGELAIRLVNPACLSTTAPSFKYKSFYGELTSKFYVVANCPDNDETAIEEKVTKILTQAKAEFYDKCPSSLHFFNAWAFRVSTSMNATATGANVFHHLLGCTNPFPEPGENLDQLLQIGEAFGCNYTTVMVAFGLYSGYRPKAEMVKVMRRLDAIVAAVQPLSPGYMAENRLLERMMHFAMTVRTMRIVSGGNGTGIPRAVFPSPSEVAMAVQWCLEQLPGPAQTLVSSVNISAGQAEMQGVTSEGQNQTNDQGMSSTPTHAHHATASMNTSVPSSAQQEAPLSETEQYPQVLPKFDRVSEAIAQCNELLYLVEKANGFYYKFSSVSKNVNGSHNTNSINVLYMLMKQHEGIVDKLFKCSGGASKTLTGTALQHGPEGQDGEVEVDAFYQSHHTLLKHAYDLHQRGVFFSYDACLAAYHEAQYAGQQQKELEIIFQNCTDGQKRAMMLFRENKKLNTTNEAQEETSAAQASLTEDEEQPSIPLTPDELDQLIDHQAWLQAYMEEELRAGRLVKDAGAMSGLEYLGAGQDEEEEAADYDLND